MSARTRPGGGVRMKQDIAKSGGGRASHRADIQALRGVAVLLVVLYHANLPSLAAGYLGVVLISAES